MYYESEADYNDAMAAQAYAEAEAEHNNEMAYAEYLDGLIASKQYDVFGIEICLTFLYSKEFEKSGLTAQQFLSYKKDKLLKPTPPQESNTKETLNF